VETFRNKSGVTRFRGDVTAPAVGVEDLEIVATARFLYCLRVLAAIISLNPWHFFTRRGWPGRTGRADLKGSGGIARATGLARRKFAESLIAAAARCFRGWRSPDNPETSPGYPGR
jgi:hypothetical protein